MSRAAVFQALTTDPELNALGINAQTLWPNFAIDSPPRDVKMFAVLRWRNRNPKMLDRGPTYLSVYFYQPRQNGSSYLNIDKAIERAKKVLTSMEHVAGGDGRTVTSIRASGGEGPDQIDAGYDAITKDIAFEVLSRPTVNP